MPHPLCCEKLEEKDKLNLQQPSLTEGSGATKNSESVCSTPINMRMVKAFACSGRKQ